MVKSGDDLGVAPFLKKCYEMVDDDSTDSIISWSPTDESFIIWDLNQLSVQLLPKYFKHNNSSSFIRQLNIYGFKKVDAERWEFANEGFIKGKRHLMKNITRRKNAQATENRKLSQQQESSGETAKKTDNEGLWKEIENLKTDKNVLMQELVKLRQFQESSDNKLVLLKDRFQGMEKNQQQMLSFLVMVVQNPGFLMQLFNPKENNWRMADPGTIIEEEIDEEQLGKDKMLVTYQPLAEEMTTKPKVTKIPQESESDPFCDGMKDPVVCPDFVKFLMDEDFSIDNYAPFVLPEIRDDSTWEQILFGSHLLQDANGGNQVGNTENENEKEKEACGTRVEPLNESESSGKMQNLEIVTKKMARLASETHQEK